MCELLVDLLDVTILGVEGHHREQVTIHFECRRGDVGCPECGVLARVKDRHLVSLVDLPMSGRPPKWCGTSAGSSVQRRRARSSRGAKSTTASR